MHQLQIRDEYDRLRYRLERLIVQGGTHLLERHYRHHPEKKSGARNNYLQKVIYLPRGMRAWRTMMPGGFATYPVHNPRVRTLAYGAKLDMITRRLFRHSYDGRGLRSRAHAMAWWLYQKLGHTKRRLRWLSLAAGTGQPTFDAGQLWQTQPDYFLSDLNTEALEFAMSLATQRGLDMKYVHTKPCDATDKAALTQLLRTVRPHVIDMMGLIEYLDDEAVVKLLAIIDRGSSALICFTNMRPTHPQLQTHQRGLGWPGVKTRSRDEVLALIERAGIDLSRVDVLLPSDKVYAVYCVA